MSEETYRAKFMEINDVISKTHRMKIIAHHPKKAKLSRECVDIKLKRVSKPITIMNE